MRPLWANIPLALRRRAAASKGAPAKTARSATLRAASQPTEPSFEASLRYAPQDEGLGASRQEAEPDLTQTPQQPNTPRATHPLALRRRAAASKGAPAETARRLASLLAALALAGCNASAQKPPAPVRPVFSTLVAETTIDPLRLAGAVAARVETPFAFRVLGRLVARPVQIGATVKQGDTLAAIDPLSLRLAVRSAEAELASATAQLANAQGVAERQGALIKSNATTQAQLEAAEQARSSALAGQTRARAALAKAKEEAAYAVLKADFPGVVTNTGAEVGQTVAPGQMVVDLADPSLRDAVIDAPDAAVSTLQLGTPFEVAAQLDPNTRITGKVREIAPQADATTRTRRIRIALDDPPDAFRLGSTITAWPAGSAPKAVRLPASAILVKDGKPYVWIVDRATLQVSTKPVTLAKADADPVEVTGGLEPNMRVVTAGVHSLTEGQPVRLQEAGQP